MNPLRAYRQQPTPTWTRIDTLLATLDGTIERLDLGIRALRQKDEPAALSLLARAHVLVLQLAAGINLDVESPASINLLRLYEFVTHSIASKDLPNLETSLGVLRTLREGFGGIREEAAELERSGVVPPVGPSAVLLTTA
jgi:flagellin-specific chaperone FliS